MINATSELFEHNKLKLSVFVVTVFMLGLQIFAWRGLYGDGAYFLLELLDKKSFFDTNEPSRLFMYWFTEWPVLLAVQSGIRNLPFLTTLFCGWLSSAPLLFWMMGLWKLRNDFVFWLFLALFTFVYFNSNFFIIGEYNLSYGLSAYCFAAMLSKEKPNLHDYAVLFLSALILIMTYPSTLFMGAGLCCMAFLKLRHTVSRQQKIYWLILGCVFALACAVGTWGYLAPATPSNKAQALNFAVLLHNKQIWFMALCMALMAMQFFISSSGGKNLVFIFLLGLEIIALAGFFRPTPFMSFSTRTVAGLSLFAGCGLIFAITYMPAPFFLADKIKKFRPLYFTIPLLFLFIQMALFDIQSSFAYNHYVHSFSKTVNEHEGFIDHKLLALYTTYDDAAFGWTWTYPSMSLILRDSLRKSIVLNPPYGIAPQPFNPLEHIPELSEYYAQSVSH